MATTTTKTVGVTVDASTSANEENARLRAEVRSLRSELARRDTSASVDDDRDYYDDYDDDTRGRWNDTVDRASDLARDIPARAGRQVTNLVRALTLAGLEQVRGGGDVIFGFADDVLQRAGGSYDDDDTSTRRGRSGRRSRATGVADLPGHVYNSFLRAVNRSVDIPGRSVDRFLDTYRQEPIDDDRDRVTRRPRSGQVRRSSRRRTTVDRDDDRDRDRDRDTATRSTRVSSSPRRSSGSYTINVPIDIETAAQRVREAFQTSGSTAGGAENVSGVEAYSRFRVVSAGDSRFPTDEKLRRDPSNPDLLDYVDLPASLRSRDLALIRDDDYYWKSEYRDGNGRAIPFGCSFIIHLEEISSRSTQITVYEANAIIEAGKRFGVGHDGPGFYLVYEPVAPTQEDRDQLLDFVSNALRWV